MKKIFVSGSQGQIGQDLLPALKWVYGANNILATDLVKKKSHDESIEFKKLDCTDEVRFEGIVKDFQPDCIIHLPAMLSGAAEKKPFMGIKINLGTFLTALEIAQKINSKIFVPSSIAAYGFNSPQEREFVDENTPQNPETIYGICKNFIERMGQNMRDKELVDFRSLRYAGVFSPIMPDGGTTDYAIEMIYDALQNKKHTCYIQEDVSMPYIYIDDLISETLKFLECDLGSKGTYNCSSFSIDPQELHQILNKDHPLDIDYQIDFRNQIALKWPGFLDTQQAQKDWNFSCLYDKQKTISQMITDVSQKINQFF